MASSDREGPCLIVNADDFGRSPGVNAAVLRAFREGILTTASLMVSGEAASEAISLAREEPRLGVGLHLTLAGGRSVLAPDQIPGLVDAAGSFDTNPTRAGLQYFFKRSLREKLRYEITAQFERFHESGLPLDHVNGHLHLHLHPVVLKILADESPRLGIRNIRLTRDPLMLNLQLARGRWSYRILHATVFHWLALHARRTMDLCGWRYTDAVLGLLQNGHVDEEFLLRLVERLGNLTTEVYCHPSLDDATEEFRTLISPRVRAAIASRGVKLMRYQDL